MAYKRVSKVLIGSATTDTPSIALSYTTGGSTTNFIQEGEIVVLDKNRQVLASDATVEDSDIIYIGLGLSNTFEEGSLTYRELEYSDPIEARHVREYFGTDYEAASEKVAAVTFGTVTPVVGTEYVVKVIYKDIHEHPANFTHTYRIVSDTTSKGDLIEDFKDKINADKKARVVATEDGSILTLTGKPIPNTTELNSIDEYDQVNFEVVVYYVSVADATYGQHLVLASDTAIAYTAGTSGNGTPALVRDAEKIALSHKGITNRTSFPVIKPDLKTSMSGTYDLVTIISDRSYVSANNQYSETAPLITQIYKPNDLSYPTFVATLDSWMESIDKEPIAEHIS